MLTVTYPTLLVFLLSTGLTMADMQYQESTISWPQGFNNLKAVNMLLRVVTENSWFCCDSGVGQVWDRCGAVGQVWGDCRTDRGKVCLDEFGTNQQVTGLVTARSSQASLFPWLH